MPVQTESPPNKVSRSHDRIILVMGLCLFLCGTWILPLLDRDEPRFAQASREMLQRHDFIVPHFNGAYRFDKPPLIYWCQAACYVALGDTVFSARLPSALFATTTALLLVAWGRKLQREQAGFHAALIFLTSLQVLIHARLAVADMPMILFFTSAVWSGWEMARPGPKSLFWWWMFHISLALGFLAKGPVAWLPWAGLFISRMLQPDQFELKPSRILAGCATTVGLVALWGVPALLATQGEFFTEGIGRHVVHRSFGVMEGHGGGGLLGFLCTIPLYFITFFLSFAPWAWDVPRALKEWKAKSGADAFGSYLLVQVAVVFAVFSLVRTKLPHYTLPAFPCLALWLAIQLPRTPATLHRIRNRVVAMCLITVFLTLGGFYLARTQLVSTNLCREARPQLVPEMKVAVVGFDEPSLVWELRRVITNRVDLIPGKEVAAFLQQDGPLCLILPTSGLDQSLNLLTNHAILFRASGYDTVRFRHWDMTAVIQK
ncbi:MAG: glycosyltransferase family 39 protein [Verrucomicrobiota bacterium]